MGRAWLTWKVAAKQLALGDPVAWLGLGVVGISVAVVLCAFASPQGEVIGAPAPENSGANMRPDFSDLQPSKRVREWLDSRRELATLEQPTRHPTPHARKLRYAVAKALISMDRANGCPSTSTLPPCPPFEVFLNPTPIGLDLHRINRTRSKR